MNIKYGERIHETEVLGPGKRSVIWVHGCCFSCPGCIGEHYKTGTPRECSTEAMADWFLDAPDITELTVSGGEPMLQAEALSETIRLIRKQRNTGLIVYSGFEYEELLKLSRADKGIKAFLEDIDILIDGPYVSEQDSNRPFIGSDNQRIILLSDRYKEIYEDYYLHTEGRKVELKLEEDKTLMVGIPGEDQRILWKMIKNKGK